MIDPCHNDATSNLSIRIRSKILGEKEDNKVMQGPGSHPGSEILVSWAYTLA
jgi:hypothetical protein